MKPDVLEGLPENIVKLFRELEERTMIDVVRRLRNNGNDIIRSADWQMYRLSELGETESQMRQYIKDILKLSDSQLDDIYEKVIDDGFSYNSGMYLGIDVSDDEGLSQLIEGIRQQTDNEFNNITQTTGFAIDKNGKISYSSVTDVLDGAMMDISSGLFDYNTVLKRVVNQMTNSGLRTIDYASGWSNRVDVAARRAVMTGVSQLTGKINESNAQKLGTDTYETSWHSGARPAHLEWQGKWFTMQELKDICGLGTVTGLCGANCYHSYTPVIPGVSEPTYTAEQLEQMKREELTPKEYGGKKYTKYEALQKQRRMETAMRAQRQKIKLLEEGGADEDDIITARCRYRGTSAEYARFSKAMDLPEQRDRVYIDGLKNIGQGKWEIDGDKMEAQFPKGYKEYRNPGEKISQDELQKFIQKVESMDIKFGVVKNKTYGGFEDYRGDPKILDEMLEHIKINRPLLTKISKDDRIILKYAYVLDDNGRVDTGAFACTKGRTITLNKFMYDDSSVLIEEYAQSVKSGHFVRGTDYRNVIDHEIGHLFSKKRSKLTRKLRNACSKRAAMSGISESQYIIENISIYADWGDEIPAELNSMLHSDHGELAYELFKEVGIL